MNVETDFFPVLIRMHLVLGIPVEVLLFLFVLCSSIGASVQLTQAGAIYGWGLGIAFVVSGWCWAFLLCKKDPAWFHRRMTCPRVFRYKKWIFH